MVVNRFREPDPDVEYPQPTADAADKAMGNKCSQPRESHEKMVVRPFRPPGKNHEEHSHDGADQPEGQYCDAMQPKLDAHVTACFGMPWHGSDRGRR